MQASATSSARVSPWVRASSRLWHQAPISRAGFWPAACASRSKPSSIGSVRRSISPSVYKTSRAPGLTVRLACSGVIPNPSAQLRARLIQGGQDRRRLGAAARGVTQQQLQAAHGDGRGQVMAGDVPRRAADLAVRQFEDVVPVAADLVAPLGRAGTACRCPPRAAPPGAAAAGPASGMVRRLGVPVASWVWAVCGNRAVISSIEVSIRVCPVRTVHPMGVRSASQTGSSA